MRVCHGFTAVFDDPNLEPGNRRRGGPVGTAVRTTRPVVGWFNPTMSAHGRGFPARLGPRNPVAMSS